MRITIDDNKFTIELYTGLGYEMGVPRIIFQYKRDSLSWRTNVKEE